MKKISAFCIFLCLLLTVQVLLPPAHAVGEDQSVSAGCHSVDAAMQLVEDSSITQVSKAVIAYDLRSDTMIYTLNPDEKIYPSSMVKLMTALVALENSKLDDKVTVSKRALSYVPGGSVTTKLQSGEVLTMEDLLYCTLIASGNDAACAMAAHIAGTQDNFVKMMNDKAAELGCTNTRYTNTTGLHDENCYTTARDICRLLDYALDNPDFTKIFSASYYTIPATNKSEERNISSTNYMAATDKRQDYYDSRVTGGKTGSTSQTGRCLAATSERNGLRLLTIVMGAKPTMEEDGVTVKTFGSYEDTKLLLDYIYERYECREIFHEGQAYSQLSVEGGSCSVVTQPERAAAAVLPLNMDINTLTWTTGNMAPLKAPLEKGQKLTDIQIWYGSKCLIQMPLLAANKVTVPDEKPAAPIDREDRGASSAVWVVLGVIAGMALLMGLLLLVRRMSVKARRRRRRAQRRRSRS